MSAYYCAPGWHGGAQVEAALLVRSVAREPARPSDIEATYRTQHSSPADDEMFSSCVVHIGSALMSVLARHRQAVVTWLDIEP